MLFDKLPGAVNGLADGVGVRFTVMVVEAPEFRAPILHVTVGGTAAPQLPCDVVMELNVAPDAGSESVTTMPLVGSPLFMSV